MSKKIIYALVHDWEKMILHTLVKIYKGSKINSKR